MTYSGGFNGSWDGYEEYRWNGGYKYDTTDAQQRIEKRLSVHGLDWPGSDRKYRGNIFGKNANTLAGVAFLYFGEGEVTREELHELIREETGFGDRTVKKYVERVAQKLPNVVE